jgi:amidophosphoribosyltransferase
MKNRYIGRTFIMPGQKERKKSVRQKLSPVKLEFSGKNVLLVDDSIVRGTTSQEIIQMARDAGAARVYFASAAPPVRYPNVYGIDMPVVSELVANGRETEEIRQEIGADYLILDRRAAEISDSPRQFPDVSLLSPDHWLPVLKQPAYRSRRHSDIVLEEQLKRNILLPRLHLLPFE